MDAVQGGTRGAPADIATLTAAAVAAVEASAAAPLPQSAAIVSAPLAAATSLFLGAAPTNEVLGVVAGNGAPTAPVESPPAAAPSTFTAAAAAAGVVHNSVASNGGGAGPGTRTVSTPKRRRLLRLEGGDLIVIPTNIYKQAGGVKLDITLGGFRIDNEKCTLKNRAYNFGVLPGFSRENILALRAFRDTLLPIDRSTPTSIHTIIAAEAITRYDEEHQKPPELASLAEESSFYGVGGWIPDSRVIHMTFTGSNMDLKVKAGDLRALDRPLQCKLALEALKSDPKVQAGTLEPAPPDLEVYGTGGTDTVGPEPGATGFARAPEPFPPSSSGARYGGKSAAKRAGGGAPRLPAGGANTEFSFLFGGGGPGFGEVDYGNEDGGDDTDSDSSKRYRKKKKKKKKKTVTVLESPAAAAAAAGGEGNAAATTVEYDLPLHVQSVEGKQCRPSLRLKVPLSGFLVDGEEVAPSELVVANGLDVTKKNLLALRACRDAVLANFAGPDLVKRVVAGEVFRVWAKRRGESAWAKRRAEAAATASTTFPPGGPGWTESAAGLLPQAVVNADDSLLLGGGGALTGPASLQQPANGPSGGGAAGMAEVAAAESAALLAATGEAEHGDGGGGGSGGGTATNGHLAVTPSTTRASTAASRVISTSGGGLAVRPPALAMEDVFTLSSPAIFPGGPRTEVQMTVAELRRARQTRSNELKRLISAMLQDPEVQAGELEVMQEMSSPAITAKNLSGAAAAAAAAEAAAVAMRANSHTIALLASGQEERERASKSSIANGGGGGGGGTATTTDGRDVASKVAERWGATLLQRSKRARAAGGGGWANPSQADPSGLGAASAAGGVSALPTTAAANSNQRKELWALAIRENELRRDMKDEDGKDGDGQEYEDRQKELLQWMVDEEAGRHDALDGGAGPPPPSWVVEKEGIGAGGGGGGEPAPLT